MHDTVLKSFVTSMNTKGKNHFPAVFLMSNLSFFPML